MKTLLIALLLLTTGILYAQPDECNDLFKPIAAARSTDSRSEAMGMTSVSSWDNINTSFDNPAGLSTIEGIQASGTYASAYYQYDSAYYTYFGIAAKVNRYLNFKLSRFEFDANEEFQYPFSNNIYDRKHTITTFGYAAEPIKNWHIGANFKLLETQFVQGTKYSNFMGDVGILGRIVLGNEKHVLKPGLSVSNVSGTTFEFLNEENKYPIFGRLGVSYEYTSTDWTMLDTLPIVSLIAQVDIEDDFTVYYRRAFKMGLEASFAKFVYLRAGYYRQTVSEWLCSVSGDIYTPSAFISALTYGIGIEAPLHEFTNLPIRIKIDYARMMEPELYNEELIPDNEYESDIFQSLTVRLDWKFGNSSRKSS
jgi:hypothetical protein